MRCKTCDRLPKCGRLVDGKLVFDVPMLPGMAIWIPGYGNGRQVVSGVEEKSIRYHVERWGGWRHERAGASRCYETEAACQVAEENR